MGFFKDCGCGCNGQKAQEQFTISVISGLTFFLVANPQMYMLMRNLVGSRVATVNGNPTMFGLILHSIVFTLVVWMMMKINKKERYEPSPGPSAEKKDAKAPAAAAKTPEEVQKIAEAKRAAIIAKRSGASKGPAPKGPAPKQDQVMSSGPAPAQAAGPAPQESMGISGFELEGFDFQLADFNGPAPKKAMVCNCPDGSTVTVN